MNYYERHIGDYLKDTSHLSLLEHGVYGRLLDVYYSREGAIPADQAERLVGARSKDERAALSVVLDEFFTVVDGAFRHERCERELDRYRDKQRKATASANARWGKAQQHTERTTDAMRTHTEGNAPSNQAPVTSNQTPDTRHQEDYGAKAPASSAGAGAQGRPIDAIASPAGAVCMALKACGIGDVAPSNQRLRMLLDAGAQVGEFTAFAAKALQTAPGAAFGYVLGAVEGERKRAAQTAGMLHAGAMPNKQQALENRNRAVGAEWLAQQGAA